MVSDIMFEVPSFDTYAIVFTAVGASLVWARMGPKKVRIFALTRLIEGLGIEGKIGVVAEFMIFVAMGVVIGVAVVQPTNVTQALAAGMGWTGLLSQPSSR